MTDTAHLAHYVLPAKSIFEQDDLVTAYWHPYLQLRRRIFDPPGQVKTESEIWRLLCRRFGFDTKYFADDVSSLSRPHRRRRSAGLRRRLPDGSAAIRETGKRPHRS